MLGDQPNQNDPILQRQHLGHHAKPVAVPVWPVPQVIFDFVAYVLGDVRLIRTERLQPFDAGLLVPAVDEILDSAEGVFAGGAVDVEVERRLVVWDRQL